MTSYFRSLAFGIHGYSQYTKDGFAKNIKDEDADDDASKDCLKKRFNERFGFNNRRERRDRVCHRSRIGEKKRDRAPPVSIHAARRESGEGDSGRGGERARRRRRRKTNAAV